jgi:hypothetical protein
VRAYGRVDVWARSNHEDGGAASNAGLATGRQRDGDVMARHVAEWRAAAWRVTDAWEVWRAARGRERSRAHELYLSAIAEEEIAADRLQRQVLLQRSSSA